MSQNPSHDPSQQPSGPARQSPPGAGGDAPEGEGGFDGVALLYILGGIPAIVAFIVILFTLVRLFPSIPA